MVKKRSRVRFPSWAFFFFAAMNASFPPNASFPNASSAPNPLFLVFLRTLHLLALALWLGGLAAIGALVAPTAFHAARTAPSLAGNAAGQNALAGAIVGGSLRLFNDLTFACAAVLLAANALLLPGASRRWTGACLAATLALLASVLFLALGLTPALDAAQAGGHMADFDRMHHEYEQVSTLLQFPLLLLLTVFTALRDSVSFAPKK